MLAGKEISLELEIQLLALDNHHVFLSVPASSMPSITKPIHPLHYHSLSANHILGSHVSKHSFKLVSFLTGT